MFIKNSIKIFSEIILVGFSAGDTFPDAHEDDKGRQQGIEGGIKQEKFQNSPFPGDIHVSAFLRQEPQDYSKKSLKILIAGIHS
jgi:hypothetical protein